MRSGAERRIYGDAAVEVKLERVLEMTGIQTHRRPVEHDHIALGNRPAGEFVVAGEGPAGRWDTWIGPEVLLDHLLVDLRLFDDPLELLWMRRQVVPQRGECVGRRAQAADREVGDHGHLVFE